MFCEKMILGKIYILKISQEIKGHFLEYKKFTQKSYHHLIIFQMLKSNTECNLSVKMFYSKLYYQYFSKEFHPIKMF